MVINSAEPNDTEQPDTVPFASDSEGANVPIKFNVVYRASYCSVLINNEMHNSYNQFLFHSILSALHVSSESSRSSSGARHNILYIQFWYNRLDSFETCRADKKLWNKN